MRLRGISLVALALTVLAIHPAAAEDLQKLTIAFAGKGMSFLLQVHRYGWRIL